MGARKGQLKDMSPGTQGSVRVKYLIPTRGLLGLRNAMLTATKGTAVLNTNFSHYGPKYVCRVGVASCSVGLPLWRTLLSSDLLAGLIDGLCLC